MRKAKKRGGKEDFENIGHSEKISMGTDGDGGSDRLSKSTGNNTDSILKSKSISKRRLYIEVMKKIWIQCFNVWCVFFVTLTVFPAVMADIKYYSKSGKYDFFIPEKLFTPVTTYLLFNLLAAVGSFLANFVHWPPPKWLIMPVIARLAFIPLLMFCYFRPEMRTWGVWIYNVWIYIILALIMSFSSGYFSSLAMMYAPRLVDPLKSPIAGMVAAFFLIFGITSGIVFTLFVSWFIDSAGPYPPGSF